MADMEIEPPNGQTGSTPAAANDSPPPLPPVASLTASPLAQTARPAQRNPIFAELVRGEDDLPGLVGYALYKQNKRDWLASFFKIHGRDPSDAEVGSYTVGERTQRRLDTYRKLASDMIDKAMPVVDHASPSVHLNPAAPPPPLPPSETARVVPARIPALKESAARGAPTGRTPVSTSTRGATATLLFWIIVLIALGVFGYWYVNSPYFH